MKSVLLFVWKHLPFSKTVKLFIVRFTQDEFLIGVTGVIFNDKNEVLLVNHSYRDGEYWSLPGGYIKQKEHPSEGLVREIEEETGYIVRITDNVRVRTDRDTARLDFSLVGTFVGGEFKASEEITDGGFFPLNALPLLGQKQLLLINAVLKKQKKGELSN